MAQNFELRKLQLLQLEISKEIKRICDKNGISYFLICGTLLGAVRHQGFIPWDDDMDIGMSARDYDRFLKLAPSQLDDRFFLQTDKTDPDCGYVFAKVRLLHTHMREKVTDGLHINDGIFVDIFPYDQISAKKADSLSYFKKLQLLGKMKMLKCSYNLNAITPNPVSRAVNHILKRVPVTRSRIDEAIVQTIRSAGGGNQNIYVQRDGMFKGNFAFPGRLFERLVELPFEDTVFKAPGGYEEYLSRAYGDYMTLPSEAERQKGHSVCEIILELPYEAYFKAGDSL